MHVQIMIQRDIRQFRMCIVFPRHLRIYDFVRRLKDEHEFRDCRSEECQVQVKKKEIIQ